jgi:hypothetical protein
MVASVARSAAGRTCWSAKRCHAIGARTQVFALPNVEGVNFCPFIQKSGDQIFGRKAENDAPFWSSVHGFMAAVVTARVLAAKFPKLV